MLQIIITTGMDSLYASHSDLEAVKQFLTKMEGFARQIHHLPNVGSAPFYSVLATTDDHHCPHKACYVDQSMKE
jgi:hypothetical protein